MFNKKRQKNFSLDWNPCGNPADLAKIHVSISNLYISTVFLGRLWRPLNGLS